MPFAAGFLDGFDHRYGGLWRRLLALPGPRQIHRHNRSRAGARLSSRETCSPTVGTVAAALRADGFWSGSISAGAGADLLPDFDADRLEREIASLPVPAGASTLRLSKDAEGSQLAFLAGLSSELNEVYRDYQNLPALFLGAEIKREVADERLGDVRQWHRDVEDNGILKAILYLSDVDRDSGPFEFLDAAASERLARRINYRSGFVPDEVVTSGTGQAEGTLSVGPKGTLIVFDGARLFHRARPPRSRDRLSVTFSYASTVPAQIFRYQRPSRTLRRRVAETSPELLARLPAAVWF